MPKMIVNDVALNYELSGQGQPIIFVPGFSASHLIWSNIAAHYTLTHSVITIDNRGSGGSDCPDYPYTVEMMADDLATFCNKLGIDSCHFVGHAMGASIIQTLAYKYPKLCRSLVLSNPFLAIDTKFALFAKGKGRLLKANAELRALIEMTIGWIFSTDFLNRITDMDGFIEAALNSPYPVTELGYRHQLHALLNFDCESWIDRITAPTLVIGTDQDAIVPEVQMRQLARMIPRADYEGILGAGHMPSIELPYQFNELVYAHIQKYSQ